MQPDLSIPEPIRITLLVTSVIEQLGIAYFIGGSLASAVHGTIRSTTGADLVVDLRIEHLKELTARLEGAFFIDPPAMVNALQSNSSFNLIHKNTMFRIDIFPLGEHPFEQNQMVRRVQQSLGDHPSDRAYFTTAEDIILAKLNWFSMGGEISEQQWRDVLGVIRVQDDTLDQDYLHIWANRLDLLDLLGRALSDALKST